MGPEGFEPAISCSQSRRIGQTFLHPESSRSSNKCPAGVEPARPPWRGGRLPLHHGHHRRPRIVKEPRAPGGTRTHVPALRGRSLRRWTTSACITMGPEGLEPSPNRLRAGRSAARTSVPIDALRALRSPGRGSAPEKLPSGTDSESARKESNLRRPVISRVFSR